MLYIRACLLSLPYLHSCSQPKLAAYNKVNGGERRKGMDEEGCVSPQGLVEHMATDRYRCLGKPQVFIG